MGWNTTDVCATSVSSTCKQGSLPSGLMLRYSWLRVPPLAMLIIFSSTLRLFTLPCIILLFIVGEVVMQVGVLQKVYPHLQKMIHALDGCDIRSMYKVVIAS